MVEGFCRFFNGVGSFDFFVFFLIILPLLFTDAFSAGRTDTLGFYFCDDLCLDFEFFLPSLFLQLFRNDNLLFVHGLKVVEIVFFLIFLFFVD